MRKILSRSASVFAALAMIIAGAFLASPAQAAIPADGTVADGVGFIQTKSTTDAGGVKYTISVRWAYKYTYLGATRVAVNPLTVYRSDANVIATGNPEDAGLDADIRTYSTNTRIQRLLFDGINMDDGIDNQWSVNPANPRSNADDPEDPSDTFSKVKIKVGTDADGKGPSVWVVFPQPAGIGFKPAS